MFKGVENVLSELDMVVEPVGKQKLNERQAGDVYATSHPVGFLNRRL
jgi:hypothetical protein